MVLSCLLHLEKVCINSSNIFVAGPGAKELCIYIPGAKDLCLDLCLDDESRVLLSMRMLPLLREAGLCPERSLWRAEGLPGGPGGPVGALRSRQLVGKKRAPGPSPAVLEFGSSG